MPPTTPSAPAPAPAPPTPIPTHASRNIMRQWVVPIGIGVLIVTLLVAATLVFVIMTAPKAPVAKPAAKHAAAKVKKKVTAPAAPVPAPAPPAPAIAAPAPAPQRVQVDVNVNVNIHAPQPPTYPVPTYHDGVVCNQYQGCTHFWVDFLPSAPAPLPPAPAAVPPQAAPAPSSGGFPPGIPEIQTP